MKKKILIILITSLIFSSVNAQTSLTQAVDFTVTDVHGNTHNLFNYLDAGKYVILDFFFTTCPPCISSVPILNQAFTDYGCNTAEVIFLSIDNDDSDVEVLQYENDYGGLLPSISGLDGGGNAVNSAYGIGAYPTVVLIAPNRTILEQDIWPVSNITIALPSHGLNTASCDTGITTILEIPLAYQNINKKRIIDVLGRYWECSFSELPKGLYIINGSKILKTE